MGGDFASWMPALAIAWLVMSLTWPFISGWLQLDAAKRRHPAGRHRAP